LNWKSKANANAGYCLLKRRHQGRLKSRATLCTHLFLEEFKGLTPRFLTAAATLFPAAWKPLASAAFALL
jgi:hypothetical protein